MPSFISIRFEWLVNNFVISRAIIVYRSPTATLAPPLPDVGHYFRFSYGGFDLLLSYSQGPVLLLTAFPKLRRIIILKISHARSETVKKSCAVFDRCNYRVDKII